MFSQQEVSQEPAKQLIVKLKDGTTMMGELIFEDAESISLSTSSLGEVTINRSDIRNISEIKPEQMKKGGLWFANPNYSRYLFTQTGRNLRKGEAYYQNVLFTTSLAHYGVTDWFSIGGGFEAISTFSGKPVFFILPKFGFNITEKISVGAGYTYANAAAAFDEEDGFKGIGFGYGVFTYGTDDNHASFGLGWGQAAGEFTNKPLYILSGMTRVSRKIALVTENWIIPTDPYYWVFTYGIKILGERSSFDIALVNSKDIADIFPVGLPIWFSYNFYF